MAQLFGTDGVRGVANQWLTPELAFYLGRAFGARLMNQTARPKVLVGRDTRASGPMLEASLMAGFNSVGVDCAVAGILPTPAIAYLTRSGGYHAGAVISASHNPVEDNGIKFFMHTGMKLSDEEEMPVAAEVARLMRGEDRLPRPVGGSVGGQVSADQAFERYVDFVRGAFPIRLDRMKIVLDCGHGAAYRAAPELFRALGADVVLLNAEPNGANINVACGSTHPHVIQEAVVAHGADAGFTFDGDADRVMAVDAEGGLLDGDHIMCALAHHLKGEGKLTGNAVVITPYSNEGLRQALKGLGVRVVEAPAGDRNVLEAMIRDGLVLGGEQSGHVILLAHNTAGDGLLTALALCAAAKAEGASFTELKKLMNRLPQVLIGVRVRNKLGLGESAAIQESIRRVEERLSGRGRIFVRASGTEPLVRVLAEGEDEEELKELVADVAQVIERELG